MPLFTHCKLQQVKAIEFVSNGNNKEIAIFLKNLSRYRTEASFKLRVDADFREVAQVFGEALSLSDFELRVLAKSPYRCTFETLAQIPVILSKSPNLCHLRVTSCYPFEEAELKLLLENLASRSTLQSLELVTTCTVECDLTAGTLALLVKALEANRGLTALTLTLKIGSNKAFFEALKGLTNLRSLNLTRSGLTNEALKSLVACLPYLVHTTSLNLDNNTFDIEHARLVREMLASVQESKAKVARKSQKRQFLRKIEDEPNLQTFYNSAKIRVEELFISIKALAGGLVMAADGDLGIYNKLFSMLAGTVTEIPVVRELTPKIISLLRETLSKILGNIDERRQRNIALNASSLISLSDLSKFAERLARRLTEVYAEQILLLATDEQQEELQGTLQRAGDQVKRRLVYQIPCSAVKQFAAYGILWILEELSNIHNWGAMREDLDAILIRALTQKEPPGMVKSLWQEVTTKLGIEGVYDKNGVTRHLDAFYRLSGIKTVNGDYFSSSRINPELYGWRLGSEEDAARLNLKKVATPDGRAPPRGQLERAGGPLFIESVVQEVQERRIKQLEAELRNQGDAIRALEAKFANLSLESTTA